MTESKDMSSLKGAAAALGSAALFGLGVPIAKELMHSVQPLLLASLLYFGSSIGLLLLWIISRIVSPQHSVSQVQLHGRDWLWLVGAILVGGVAAQLLELSGLHLIPASEASLLLNLESVFTALLARLIFREHVGPRVATGLGLLTAGAIALSVGPNWQLSFSIASWAVVASGLAWAIDNNCTKRIAHGNAIFIVMVKGFFAALINLFIAYAAGALTVSPVLIGAGMAVGFFSYGLSLTLFVTAMRYIGAARAGSYFCANTFFAAAVSILLLKEPITAPFAIATTLMAVGIWLNLTEQHDHVHTHGELVHEHGHIHDEHHQHEHATNYPDTDIESHSHMHSHAPVTHAHHHKPDIHHDHDH
jgi:drug/metabolite transporter (DMT)-like permease